MDLVKDHLYKLSLVKPIRRSRIVLVNQNKNVLLIGLVARDRGLSEVKAYMVDGVPPIAVIDGRVYFIGQINGLELASLISCIHESVLNEPSDIRDGLIVITEEHCYWCVPFIHAMCRMSYRDGFVVSVIDFNYKPELWYDKMGIDEVPTLIHRGRIVPVGSSENPDEVYEYVRKIIVK